MKVVTRCPNRFGLEKIFGFCHRSAKNLLWSVLLVVGVLTSQGVAGSAERDLMDYSPYGVCAHFSFTMAHPDIDEEFVMIENLGVRWLRVDCIWRFVEHPSGNWHFSELDRIVELSKRDTIHLVFILRDIAPQTNELMKNLAEWDRFVDAVVSRYKNSVQSWEVWNEENISKFWNVPNPDDYTVLLDSTCGTIKRIDPSLTVVFGGTSGVDVGYIRRALDAGAGNYFDVLAIHPYEVQPQNIPSALAQIESLMGKERCRGKKIWFTEWGWSSPNNDGALDTLQASSLAIGWNVSLQDTNLSRVFWYEFKSPETRPNDKESFFGLARADLSPKLVYRSYATLIASRPPLSKPGVTIFAGNGLVLESWVMPDKCTGWMLFSQRSEGVAVLRTQGNLKDAYDFLGNKIHVQSNRAEIIVNVRKNPIYVLGPEKMDVVSFY